MQFSPTFTAVFFRLLVDLERFLFSFLINLQTKWISRVTVILDSSYPRESPGFFCDLYSSCFGSSIFLRLVSFSSEFGEL